MKKKNYMSPDFKIVILKAKYRLLDGSPYTKENTKKDNMYKEDNGGYFD